MNEKTEKIIKIMKEAAKIISAHDRAFISDSEISSKDGAANYVTVYDVQVQNYLIAEYSKLFPKAVFLGEEDSAKSDKNISDSEELFIIDPIDGTTNFIHNVRHSAISVAYAEDGKTEIGCVLNPYTGEIFYAENGNGAYLISGENVHKINVSNRNLKDALVVFGTTPYDRGAANDTFDIVKKLYLECRDVRRLGSAALDLCYIACGRFDFFFETMLSPWDFAAGALIVSEAGGVISDNFGNKLPLTSSSYVAAGNKNTYSDVMKMNILQ